MKKYKVINKHKLKQIINEAVLIQKLLVKTENGKLYIEVKNKTEAIKKFGDYCYGISSKTVQRWMEHYTRFQYKDEVERYLINTYGEDIIIEMVPNEEELYRMQLLEDRYAYWLLESRKLLTENMYFEKLTMIYLRSSLVFFVASIMLSFTFVDDRFSAAFLVLALQLLWNIICNLFWLISPLFSEFYAERKLKKEKENK